MGRRTVYSEQMEPLCIRVPRWLRTALWHAGALEGKRGTTIAREWLEERARATMPMPERHNGGRAKR